MGLIMALGKYPGEGGSCAAPGDEYRRNNNAAMATATNTRTWTVEEDIFSDLATYFFLCCVLACAVILPFIAAVLYSCSLGKKRGGAAWPGDSKLQSHSINNEN
jgi:hypothetical protein